MLACGLDCNMADCIFCLSVIETGFEHSNSKEEDKDWSDSSDDDQPVVLPCGHIQRGVKCTFPCNFRFPDCNHQCKLKCGDDHSHDKCMYFGEYAFPCGHLSPRKKMCWEEIVWSCMVKIPVKLDCGHTVKKPCGIDNFICYFPCQQVFCILYRYAYTVFLLSMTCLGP